MHSFVKKTHNLAKDLLTVLLFAVLSLFRNVELSERVRQLSRQETGEASVK